MKLSNSFTTVTPLSKILAILLFVLLPFIGFILGVNYQKTTAIPPSITLPIPTPRIETNLPTNEITVSNFRLQLPLAWRLTGLNEYGASSIVTATTPYEITLTLKITKTNLDKYPRGDQVLGETVDGASIYNEVTVVQWVPYIIVYSNDDAYRVEWEYSSTGSYPSDDMPIPLANFTREDLLSIVKSAIRTIDD